MDIKTSFLKSFLKQESKDVVKQDSSQNNIDNNYFLEREVENVKKRWNVLNYIESLEYMNGLNLKIKNNHKEDSLPSFTEKLTNLNKIAESGEETSDIKFLKSKLKDTETLDYDKVSNVKFLKSVLFKK